MCSEVIGLIYYTNVCVVYGMWTLCLSVTLIIQCTLFDNKIKYQGIFF